MAGSFGRVFGRGPGIGAILRIVAIVLILAGSVASTAHVAFAQDYAFSSVKIEGNARVEPATILSYAGIPKGQRISAAQLNDAYQRLVNSGLFEAVDLVPQGSTLVIKVTEYPTINVISVEGNRRLKDDEVLAVIKSQPRRIYSPAQAEQDTAAIVELYRSKSRMAASVSPKIIRRSENRVDLVFEVAEGKVVETERISFVGNRHYSDSRLRRILNSKQTGIFRAFVQADSYDAARLEFDKQVLRDFYLSRGYIDFRIKSVSSEFSREKNGYFVVFDIEEGQSYKLGALSVASEVPDIDLGPYQAQMKLRSGTVYTPTLVDNTITRMENLAIKQGLTFIRVDPRVTKHEREGTVDIAFTLVKGPRIFVERIDIEGNKTTLDRVIRSQFRTVEGDPFNPREIRQAAERIRALGFFTTADVQTRPGSSSDQVIVDVNVDEANTGSLALGGTYSADSGIGLAISLTETNFLGRGQALRFIVNTAADSQNYLLDFTEPHLLGRSLTGRLVLSYTTTENYNAHYSSQVGLFAPSIEFPISENGRLGLRYSFRYSRMYNVSNESSIILHEEADQGDVYQSAPGIYYSYDTRRNGVDPLGGWLFKISQDFGGLGGNGDYLKTSAQILTERHVLNESVTLRASLEGGAIKSVTSEPTRIVDRFVLGSSQLRGFEYAGMGPRDLAAPNEDALGGNFYAVMKLESEFPLGGLDQYGMSGGAFLDMGSLWGLDNTNGGTFGPPPNKLGPVDDSAHLRAAIGVSLFWTTPFGPLRFNFSHALIKESYDKTQNFDITVSTTF